MKKWNVLMENAALAIAMCASIARNSPDVRADAHTMINEKTVFSGVSCGEADDADANSRTYWAVLNAFSVVRYSLNNTKPGKSMQELASATAMYGYYAKNYFNA